MWFNNIDIEKQLLYFLFFYISGSFEKGKLLQGTACGFFNWPLPNQVS